MSIKASFYSFLLSQTSITNELGAVDAIFLNRIPQQLNKQMPALSYRQTNDEDVYLLDGTASSLKFAEIEVNCWAFSAPQAEALAQAVRDALTGYSGPMGANTVDPIRKTFDDGDFEVDTDLHFVRLVFVIPYR